MACRELLKVANSADLEMLKSVFVITKCSKEKGKKKKKKAICCVLSGTHRQDDVSNVDAPILIDSAAFHYALHYHTGTVDWGEQDKIKGKVCIDCTDVALLT